MNSLEMLKEAGIEIGDVKLHLGCGETYLDGYVNIDFSNDQHAVMKPKVDAHADIAKDLVFPQNSVDEIRLHHVFEHFSRVSAIAQLIKWNWWLKIGGKLIIEVPDFAGVAKMCSDITVPYEIKIQLVRHLTGDQSSDWGYHIDQWWDFRMKRTLVSLGFDVVDVIHTAWDKSPFLPNITVTAKKNRETGIQTQIGIGQSILSESMVSANEAITFGVWCKQLQDMLPLEEFV